MDNKTLKWLWDTNVPPPDYDSVYLACKPVKGVLIYKIGWSSDPDSRMKQLGKNVELVWSHEYQDAGTVEKALHDHFAEKRLYGEWFDLDDADVEYIKGLTT